MKLYAVEFEVVEGPRLVEQTTAHVHALSPDEAVAYVRAKHRGRALRVVRIERDPEPDCGTGVELDPLEPMPPLGARCG